MRTQKATRLLPLLLVLACGPAGAGAEQVRTTVRFEHIGLEEGLAQSSVTAIAQDSVGYIWLGTEDGLQLYDGYRFRTFRREPDNPESLSNNFISALLEGRDGTLWVGTYGGLNRYDPDTGDFTDYAHEHPGFNAVAHNYVWTLAQHRPGELWVGTDAGLERLDIASGEWQVYRAGEGAGSGLASDTIWDGDYKRSGTGFSSASRNKSNRSWLR